MIPMDVMDYRDESEDRWKGCIGQSSAYLLSATWIALLYDRGFYVAIWKRFMYATVL
jgi:hypothetical protein